MIRKFSSNPVRLAITLGDPAGVGPEVVLRSLARRKAHSRDEILLIGRASLYTDLARHLKLPLSFFDLDDPKARTSQARSFPCFHPDRFPKRIVLGKSVAAQTQLAVRSIEAAVRLAMEGIIDGIVTPPLY